MGGNASKRDEGAVGLHAGDHTPLPDHTLPYPGTCLEYSFININTKLTTEMSLKEVIIATDIEDYYSTISEPYKKGYLLGQFQTLPGLKQKKGMGLTAIKSFQAMHCRPTDDSQSRERWELQVVKSFLETQKVLRFSSKKLIADTTDIHEKIHEMAAKGGRLICIEITGFEKLARLGKGITEAKKMLNSIWFFEKEADKVDDDTPIWEGTIVEYEQVLKAKFNGNTKAVTSWDSVVVEMGKRGWELAAVVEKPGQSVFRVSTIFKKVLLFFQRRLLHE